MPTIIVNANPCSTSPPKKNSASALSSAVPAVITVRPIVWLTDVLTIVVEVVAPHAAHVLAHAVEDDDRVVGRVAGDRQDARR